MDGLGNRYIKDEPHNYKLFIETNNNHDTVSLNGKKLKTKEFDSPNSLSKYIRESKDLVDIYGMDKPEYQFISDKYHGDLSFKFENLVIANVDIETEIGKGFPVPHLAEQEINSISYIQIGRDVVTTWTTLDYDTAMDLHKEKYQDGTAKIILCADEKEIFLRFLAHWNFEKPDAITGWFIKGFDIPYLINRGKQIVPDHINTLSPINEFVHGEPFYACGEDIAEKEYKIDGLDILDFMELYKKFNFDAVPDYKLETIAQKELKEGKIDYCGFETLKDFYIGNPTMFIRYNQQDVLLINKLNKKLAYLELAYILAYEAKVNPSDIFGQVKFWDVLIYNYLKSKNIQIPPHKKKDKTEFVGAFVRDVVVGKSKYIVSVDLTSLYPMCMVQYNISPDTLFRPRQVRDNLLEQLINCEQIPELDDAHNLNMAMAANGSLYKKYDSALYPDVVKHIFAKRKEYKANELDVTRKIESLKHTIGKSKPTPQQADTLIKLSSEKAIFKAKQMAMKIAINSLYGASGNVGFRYYDITIAEAITMSGQLASRYIGRCLIEYLNKMIGEPENSTKYNWIVAGDTDSVYLTIEPIIQRICGDRLKTLDKNIIIDIMDKFCTEKIETFIEQKYEELAKYMNAKQNAMEMKREVLADVGIWRAKKNYILRVYDNEHVRYDVPQIKMMGIETARSESPAFVKDELKECINLMLDDDKENQLIDRINKYKEIFYKASVQDISIYKGVNGIDKWTKNGYPIKGAPFNVCAASGFNRLIDKHGLIDVAPISNGDKVRIIMLKMPNPAEYHYFAFNGNIPKELNIEPYIDYGAQYEKLFLKPIQSFTNIIGWATERNSLDDYF